MYNDTLPNEDNSFQNCICQPKLTLTKAAFPVQLKCNLAALYQHMPPIKHSLSKSKKDKNKFSLAKKLADIFVSQEITVL